MIKTGWSESAHSRLAANSAPKVPRSAIDGCRKILEDAFAQFGNLPMQRSVELYLILAIGTVPQDGSEVVVFDPEFLFLFDFGFESLAGVSVPWSAKGRGDPNFPEFGRASLRSVPTREEQTLLYPRVAGSLILGLANGIDEKEAQAKLEGLGLLDIEISSTFATARCKPFHEGGICAEIEAKAAEFVRYAEPNRVVRIIDFGPGWSVQKLT